MNTEVDPPLGGLPDPGIEPALVGGSFTTSATWEAHKYTEFPEHFYATSYKSIIREGDITDGEGNGNPLQNSCLENPVDRGVWWAAVLRVAQSWTRLKRFSSSNRHYRN